MTPPSDWTVMPEHYPPSTFISPKDQLFAMRAFIETCTARQRGKHCQACAFLLASIAEIELLRAAFPTLQISDGPSTR